MGPLTLQTNSLVFKDGVSTGTFSVVDSIFNANNAQTGDFTMLFAGLISMIGLASLIILISLKRTSKQDR